VKSGLSRFKIPFCSLTAQLQPQPLRVSAVFALCSLPFLFVSLISLRTLAYKIKLKIYSRYLLFFTQFKFATPRQRCI
ncbi:hypothetical protein M5D96_008913, partial [Drosophila gunungcola]